MCLVFQAIRHVANGASLNSVHDRGIQADMTASSDTGFAAWQFFSACFLHASQVHVTQIQDIVCIALLQMDVTLHATGHNPSSCAAATSLVCLYYCPCKAK